MSHEDFVKTVKRQLVDVAGAILGERMNVLEGVRKICSLRHDSGNPEDKLFLTFRAIDSETDHFPLGEMRSRYDKAKLAKLDEEMATYIADAKEDVFKACNDLIREFSS